MRKIYYLSILTVLALTLPGCRSTNTSPAPQQSHSSTASAPTPVPAQAQLPASPKDSRPLLVCFGDSLTAGLGTAPGQAYPDYLQTDLDKLGYHYHVDNEGVSGNTTKDGVDRLPGILALHPTIVVVEFGGNDGLRGLPIADTRANLDRIVSTLLHAGIKVVIAGITLPPDYGPDYIHQFDRTYVLIANKYHVPMLPFLLQNVYGVPGMMQRDETHATPQGNQIVARNVLRLLHPLLKK